MSTFALNLDSEDDSLVQMTKEQLSAFSKNKSGKEIKSKEKNKKKKSKEKSKSKSKQKGRKRQKRSSSSSPQVKKQAKPRQPRRKSLPMIRLSAEQRFGQQIQQSEVVKYGNAKLVKIGGKSPISAYSLKARDTLRTGVTWWIVDGQYIDQNWTLVFSDVYQIQTRQLRLHNNNYPNIIREIHHIRFDNLQFLSLYDNNIRSLQLLSRMRFPILKDLSLRNNKITSIRSLSKMSLKNLTSLSLTDNFISDFSKMYYVNTESLVQIFLEWGGNRAQGEDLGWMAKLKKNPNFTKVTSLMLNIVVQSNNRIMQRTVDEHLTDKYRQQNLIKRKTT